MSERTMNMVHGHLTSKEKMCGNVGVSVSKSIKAKKKRRRWDLDWLVGLPARRYDW
jgi:hypothetical protein